MFLIYLKLSLGECWETFQSYFWQYSYSLPTGLQPYIHLCMIAAIFLFRGHFHDFLLQPPALTYVTPIWFTKYYKPLGIIIIATAHWSQVESLKREEKQSRNPIKSMQERWLYNVSVLPRLWAGLCKATPPQKNTLLNWTRCLPRYVWNKEADMGTSIKMAMLLIERHDLQN